MSSVYLAGPILGLTKAKKLAWRNYAAEKFRPLEVYSPLRGYEHLFQEDGQMDPTQCEHPLRHPQAFIRRDLWDVRRCDALFCNFLGAKAVSIGTCMEIAVARDHHKYIAVLMEPDNIHRYSMILEAASFVETDLDRAIEFTKVALLPNYIPNC